eukprot:238280-Ditylum_brightwellii.AAC.1
MGFGVLSHLGVQRQSLLPDKSAVLRDLMALKSSLVDLSDAELLNYREMVNSDMVAAMSFLQPLLF